jgi:concanavalin A-like lectin/glucanase superfamily protein
MPWYTNYTSGANRYVQCGNVAPIQFERTNAFTLLGWINTTNPAFQVICGKTSGLAGGANVRGYDFYLSSTGRIGFNRNSNFEGGGNYAEVNTDATGFNDGKWKHVACSTTGTNSASGMLIYVNGLVQATHINSDTLTATILNSAQFVIGQQSTLLAGQFLGGVYGVSAHNRVLTPTEILDAARLGPFPGPGLNTVGAWLMGEASSPPTIPDVSPNSNNGTMVNLVQADILYTDIGNKPVVSNIVPAPGSLGRNTPVQFDVTDDLGLAAVLVYVTYPGRPTELIHDGTAFRYPYLGSSRALITGGFRFVVQRNGGWQAAPSFVAHAIDTEGRENA